MSNTINKIITRDGLGATGNIIVVPHTAYLDRSELDALQPGIPALNLIEIRSAIMSIWEEATANGAWT